MMPEISGFEICERLKADSKYAHIPVVMVTALSDTQDRVMGLRSGADDFLTKPINEMALFARIRSLVRMKIMMDELKLRNQTGHEIGLSMVNDEKNSGAKIEGGKILLIDDDLAQSQRICNVLAGQKQNANLLKDITKSREYVDQNKDLDLIIVSTQLADHDGLRLCSQIRSQESGRHVPILILVEEDEQHLIVKGLDMGVNDYIITPMDDNELIARVNTQIRKNRYHNALKNSLQNTLTMSVTDPLTELNNRRCFDVHIKKMVETSKENLKSLAVAFVDIDHFKKVNDVYGHAAGDEVLKSIAKILKAFTRITDFVARYGGEEFVILMPSTDPIGADTLTSRLNAVIKENKVMLADLKGQPHLISVTASIGVAFIETNDTVETLLARADQMLYKAKEGGRDRVIMSKSITTTQAAPTAVQAEPVPQPPS
jgi:two-component system cell cycle response regulator